MSTSPFDTRVGIAPSEFRLPDVVRLGPVRLQVSDLDSSITFYKTVLGFAVFGRTETTARLGPVEGISALVVLEENPDARPVRRRSRLGLFHIAYLLPSRADLGRFVHHLRDHGVQAGMSDHLVSEAIYLSDPDGLGIEVYADRPRDEWKRDGREIAMATKPLDVENLLSAAEDRSWTGAPEGTRVGHVHLHVGDLDRAADFYHDTLGFDKMVWSYPGALFLGAGGYHHHLGLNTWAGDVPPPRDDEAQLLEWTIIVPTPADVNDTVHRLEAKGDAIAREGTDGIATDPWGTRLRITSAD